MRFQQSCRKFDGMRSKKANSLTIPGFCSRNQTTSNTHHGTGNGHATAGAHHEARHGAQTIAKPNSVEYGTVQTGVGMKLAPNCIPATPGLPGGGSTNTRRGRYAWVRRLLFNVWGRPAPQMLRRTRFPEAVDHMSARLIGLCRHRPTPHSSPSMWMDLQRLCLRHLMSPASSCHRVGFKPSCRARAVKKSMTFFCAMNLMRLPSAS